jgi:DNA-binding XRE family transcriptional regulator
MPIHGSIRRQQEIKPMATASLDTVDHRSVELDGIRYVILREAVFKLLCQRARVKQQHPSDDHESSATGFDMDRASLAQKLVRRRRAAGLSQAALARCAGVRPETLNRIERGRTTPDFATVRKLVVAMNAAEAQHAAMSISQQSCKETSNVDGDQSIV